MSTAAVQTATAYVAAQDLIPAKVVRFNANSTATTNATSVKAAPARLFNLCFANANAAARWLKIYDLAVAPTVGTSVPMLDMPIPAAGVLNLDFGPQGMDFPTGLAFAVTTLAGDIAAVAITAADLKMVMNYA